MLAYYAIKYSSCDLLTMTLEVGQGHAVIPLCQRISLNQYIYIHMYVYMYIGKYIHTYIHNQIQYYITMEVGQGQGVTPLSVTTT